MALNSRAFLLTTSFYVLLLLLLIFRGFTSEYMIPSEEGILVNFGRDEAGFGEIEPTYTEKIAEPSQQLDLPVIEKKQVIITQDYEDAESLEGEKTKPEADKPVERQITNPNATYKPVEEKPQTNTNALWGKNRNTTSTASEGVVPGGTGNQGSPGGDINSDNHSIGGGFGNGVSASLEGRESVSLQRPPKMQSEGIIVVEVTVNRNGKVVNAVPGVKGSTTLDSQLKEAAKNAALSSRFSVKEDAPEFQKGKISYHFRY
jgi:colicin import membrane protein